ncbi:iron ABC transporter permease [Zobellella endophytica]|uniref:Iron ABC transporter permease n=1 Tax=Zobellella endophytica TaxID=2116700 RepID=A0A2P7R0J7_9GAMM|nr:iron ABC transporter permease [Zobellella endophytica]PSJ43744.1 iron ABC transporter permease [Zobellella endophytica]
MTTRPVSPWRRWLPLAVLLLLPLALLLGGDNLAGPGWRWLLGGGEAMPPVDYLVLTELRLPRLLAALLIGAALGTAGCLLQRLTHNPLASPGLLGLNQGAALGLVCLLISPLPFTLWHACLAALGGAALAMVLVFGVVRLATGRLAADSLLLFGALLSTLLGGLGTMLLLLDQHALDVIRFWLAGSLSLVVPAQLPPLAALVFPALLLALLCGRPLEILETGGDTARSLGLNPVLVLLAVSAVVLLLTAASVAVSGPILFVGLVVPHMARFWLGERLHRQLIGSMVLGAGLLAAADGLVLAVDEQDRLPPGMALALLGVPWFLWLVRRRYLER